MNSKSSKLKNVPRQKGVSSEEYAQNIVDTVREAIQQGIT